MATRILYVHGIGAIGGAELDLLMLLRHLDQGRWTPVVACPPEGEFRTRVEALGIPLFPVKFPAWRKVSSWLSRRAAVQALCAAVSSCRPTFIHVNDLWWVPQTLRAVKRMGGHRIPVIAHVRQHLKPRKAHAYELHRVDRVVAVSHRAEDALVRGGVSPAHVSTVYSGVDMLDRAQEQSGADVRMRHGIPPDAYVLGTVANLLPIKGLETMIEAFPAVRRKMPTVHYMIVGAGSEAYVRELLNLCKDRAVSEAVHFVGFHDPPWPYLASMDLYVQPSKDEALGIAAIEAMAMGIPVVASRVGGLPEVVDHERTGLLVTPDNPKELSEAILSLLRDDVRRKAMGECGAQVARERFDVRSSVAAIERLYLEVVNAGRAGE